MITNRALILLLKAWVKSVNNVSRDVLSPVAHLSVVGVLFLKTRVVVGTRDFLNVLHNFSIQCTNFMLFFLCRIIKVRFDSRLPYRGRLSFARHT